MTGRTSRRDDSAGHTSVAAFDVAPELADLHGESIGDSPVRDEAA